MAAPALRHGSFRYADLCRWPEGERWELIDGHAYAMAPPNWAHQSVVFELGAQLRNQLLGKPCQARSGPVGVRLPVAGEDDADIRNYFEPDLLVVCDPAKIDTRGVRGAPDLIIEVLSPPTASYDQIDKRRAYERASVRELWLVDVVNGLISIHRHDSRRYAAPELLRTAGRIPVGVLPGVELDLDFVAAYRPADDADAAD
jgi:Uma2 family endonuclease